MQNLRKAINLKILILQGCIRLKQIDSSFGFPINLTYLNLNNCRSLINLPHFREAINLKHIDLKGCIQLKQIDSSIGFAKNLTMLNLEDCRNLINLPHFREAINLKTLHLKGCIQLKQIDSSFGFPKNLIVLNLKHCRSLINLPHFREAINLKRIDLEGCTKLRQIDSSIGLLRNLCFLNLKDCKSLVSLPNILELNSLEYLNLFSCSPLYSNQLLEEPRDAEHSKELCTGEVLSHSPSMSSIVKRWFMKFFPLYSREQNEPVNWLLPSWSIFSCMVILDLSFCNLVQVPNAIGNLYSLQMLRLRGNNFAVMPSLKELSNLVHLNLQHCKRLEYLPELPSRCDLSPYMWEIGNESDDEKPLGLNAFNCPELAKREGCSNMCILWIMQRIKAHRKYDDYWKYYLSITPGSEIPRWFNSEHVCTDNSITIDQSGVLHDGDLIGVALSVIFVARNQRRMAPPKKHVHIPLLFHEDIVTVESDHLYLCCLPRAGYTELVFEMVGSEGYDVEVKKYGYRFVYEKDLQLSNLTMMRSETSLPRKRKFSAIQEIE